MGGSIGRNLVNIRRGSGSGSSLFNLEDDRSQFFARLHLAFSFSGSSTVAFAIKPYVQIPLTDINLQAVASRLNASNNEFNERFPMFVLSFAFYNGRQ